MAKNWRPGDALEVIRAGEDKEAIADICRRFPLFAINATSEAGLVELIKAIPSHISARQINKGLIEGVEPYEYEDEAPPEKKASKGKSKKDKEDKKEKPAGKKGKKASKKEKEDVEEDDWDDDDEETTKDGPDFSKMTQSELKEAAKELGCKIKKGMTKADVVAMLEKAVGKPEDDDEDDDDDWDI